MFRVQVLCLVGAALQIHPDFVSDTKIYNLLQALKYKYNTSPYESGHRPLPKEPQSTMSKSPPYPKSASKVRQHPPPHHSCSRWSVNHAHSHAHREREIASISTSSNTHSQQTENKQPTHEKVIISTKSKSTQRKQLLVIVRETLLCMVLVRNSSVYQRTRHTHH